MQSLWRSFKDFGRSRATTPDPPASEFGGHLWYFLLVYDAREGELISQEQFLDVSEAMGAFAEAEWNHRDPYQVLLFSADSIETVRATHPHYFRTRDDDQASAVFGGPPVAA